MLALRDLHVFVLAAERGCEVALSRVVRHRHDRRQVRAAARQLERGRHVAAGRDAAEDAFLGGEPPRHRQTLGGGRRDDSGKESDVEVLGDEPVADALDAVRSPLAPDQERALVGLDRVETHPRVMLAQEAPHARERAAAALRGDERADDTSALLPDLGACGLVMGLGVVELPRDPVAWPVARADLLEAPEREIHVALAAGREDEVGAVGAHDFLTLLAHPLGHDDRAAIALDGRDEGAGDPGVAGRALEHAHPRVEIAPRFGAVEHVQIDAVLEAARRAVPLELHVDRRCQAGGHAVERNERRAPDRLGDGPERTTVRVPENRHGSVTVPEIRGTEGPVRGADGPARGADDSARESQTIPLASKAAGMWRISKRPSPRGVTATTSNRQWASAMCIHLR